MFDHVLSGRIFQTSFNHCPFALDICCTPVTCNACRTGLILRFPYAWDETDQVWHCGLNEHFPATGIACIVRDTKGHLHTCVLPGTRLTPG